MIYVVLYSTGQLEVKDHPQSGWLEFLRFGGERQKHFSALNGALATGCAPMTVPCFLWDVLKPLLVLCPTNKFQNSAQGLKGFCERH
jgi:hypothetical protein